MMQPGMVVRTFAEAAASYIEHGGQAQYLGRIVDRVGEKPMTEIFPFDVKQFASQLYPAHQTRPGTGASSPLSAPSSTMPMIAAGGRRSGCAT
jgi:hypothetical protein